MILVVTNYIEKILKKYKNLNLNAIDDRKGRIGPKNVRFDVSTYYGLFNISPDRLHVYSQSNFGTVRSNAGVYKGKWMYEVQIGSRGVMQLGWSTAQCKFNQETGVGWYKNKKNLTLQFFLLLLRFQGDVPNSYAYDGNRMKKWNVATHKYGEAWVAGDVIGSTIDMDEGTISFLRNGKNLGTAFDKISMGPGIVYFPTVSLAYSEKLSANFGLTSMRYQVNGYQTLEQAPLHQVQKSKILFDWFEKLLIRLENNDETNDSFDKQLFNVRTFLLCLARIILKEIGLTVDSTYVAQETFIPLIKKLKIDNTLDTCLDLMWSILEVHEMKVFLETTITYFFSIFRQVSNFLEFPEQRATLELLNRLCQHGQTRRYLLQFVLFENNIVTFIHVKPIEDDRMTDIVNKIWYENSSMENNKTYYENSCDKIKFWTSGKLRLCFFLFFFF